MFRHLSSHLQAIHGLFHRSISSTYEMLEHMGSHTTVWDPMCDNISYVLDIDG
jgi:hypothetical protein